MLRILLVEDEPDLAEIQAAVLEDAGYHVTVAHDGLTGLTSALQEHPELVITDFMMPRLNGLDMIEQLRRANYSAPIVLEPLRDGDGGWGFRRDGTRCCL